MEFLSPSRLWFLLLIPAVVAVYVYLQHRRAQYALRFTNIALLDRVAPRRPQWRRHLAVTFALLACISCIVAFAQPKDKVKVPRERATIVVAIDVSLSMMATDIDPNRLEAAKRVSEMCTIHATLLHPPTITVELSEGSGATGEHSHVDEASGISSEPMHSESTL